MQQLLVIPGLPKCGTSSMFAWLSEHPNICPSIQKEPFYLIDQDHPYQNQNHNIHTHGIEGYARCWPSDPGAAPDMLYMEATTHYVYQQTALKTLSAMTPEPYVLIMLRKPSERLQSAFYFGQQNRSIARDLDFSTFVRLAMASKLSEMETFMNRSVAQHYARQIEYGYYDRLLEPWMQAFGSRLKILFLETVTASPLKSIQDVCSWLNVDVEPYQKYDFPIQNATRYPSAFAGFRKKWHRYKRYENEKILEELDSLYEGTDTAVRAHSNLISSVSSAMAVRDA